MLKKSLKLAQDINEKQEPKRDSYKPYTGYSQSEPFNENPSPLKVGKRGKCIIA